MIVDKKFETSAIGTKLVKVGGEYFGLRRIALLATTEWRMRSKSVHALEVLRAGISTSPAWYSPLIWPVSIDIMAQTIAAGC